jgi:hypothetical protein
MPNDIYLAIIDYEAIGQIYPNMNRRMALQVLSINTQYGQFYVHILFVELSL